VLAASGELQGGEMAGWDIAYIKTEPAPQALPCRYSKVPRFRCTIELVDGTVITRCGGTVLHALANAIACYKTSKGAVRRP